MPFAYRKRGESEARPGATSRRKKSGVAVVEDAWSAEEAERKEVPSNS